MTHINGVEWKPTPNPRKLKDIKDITKKHTQNPYQEQLFYLYNPIRIYIYYDYSYRFNGVKVDGKFCLILPQNKI